MPKPFCVLPNEVGSISAVGLLILALLTLLGLSATRTSRTEVQITTNAQKYQMNFFIAESGWKEGALWVDGLAGAPRQVNNTGDPFELSLVRNFGDGGPNVLNDTFPDATWDRIIESIPYWFRVAYLNDQRAAGNDRSHRRFNYLITANADKSQEIDVQVSKIYKVGY